MADRFGYGEIGLDINLRHPCEGCRDYDAPDGCKSNGGCGKPQTNSDRIRSMSDEELAAYYFTEFFRKVPYCHENCPAHDDCQLCLLEWLKQETES